MADLVFMCGKNRQLPAPDYSGLWIHKYHLAEQPQWGFPLSEVLMHAQSSEQPIIMSPNWHTPTRHKLLSEHLVYSSFKDCYTPSNKENSPRNECNMYEWIK